MLTRVATADVQDLELGLNILGDYILDAVVDLVPVELISIPAHEAALPLVSIFPKLVLAVLCHFKIKFIFAYESFRFIIFLGK